MVTYSNSSSNNHFNFKHCETVKRPHLSQFVRGHDLPDGLFAPHHVIVSSAAPLHLTLKGPLPLKLWRRVAVIEAELVIVLLPLLVVNEDGVRLLDLQNFSLASGLSLLRLGWYCMLSLSQASLISVLVHSGWISSMS